MQIKIAVAADTKKAQAEFAALAAQVKALNADIAGAAMVPKGGTAEGYRRIASSMAMVDREFTSALASSGKYRVEQIKVNDAVSRNTELLQQQKLKMREVFGGRDSMARKNMQAVYREQLAMQQMVAKVNDMGISDGKMRASLLIPNEVHSSWDTLNKRVGMFGYQLASASETMVNWGKNTQWAGRQLMVGFTMPALAFGAAAGVMAYKVDEAMTRITKVYDVSAAAQKDEALRQKELADVRVQAFKNGEDAARAYGVAIEDTLTVQSDLAATGLTGEKLNQSTRETVRIATLGDLDFTQATDMTVALQNAFRDTIKTSDDLTNAFNYMNAVENATSLSIQDIAEATPRAASAMSALGVSVEQMTTLLVSMREAGVDAAEGANALKSATGTILSPSPAAIEFIKGIAGDKIAANFENIRELSGGNLYTAMQQIFEWTEELSKSERQAVITKLFGKYQFNRVSAMVYNLGEAFEGTQNQTRKAMDLMGSDMNELQKRADDELGQITESMSGKFKIAWQSLRAELAGMGEPFLNVATWALEAVTKIAAAFNKLPDSVKHLAMIGVIGMAVIGPMVMLIGLFANFMGNIGKFTAFLLKAASGFQVFNKAEWANQLATKLAARGLVTQGDATLQLAGRTQVLTEALEKYNKTLLEYTGIAEVADQADNFTSGPVPVVPVGRTQTPGNPPENRTIGPMTYDQTLMAMGVNPNATKQADKQALENAKKRLAVAGYQQSMEAATARFRAESQRKAIEQAEAENRVRQKTAGAINMGSVAMTAMVAGSTALMFSSNETLNNIIKMGMIGSILVPAVGMLARGFATATKWAWGLVTAQLASARAAAAGTIAQAGAMAALRASAAGAGSAMLGLVGGPIGAAVVGVGAITYGLYKWQQHAEAVSEEYERQNNALYNQQEAIEEIMNIRTKKMQSLAPSFAPEGTDEKAMELSEMISSSDNRMLKDLVSLIDETEDETKLATIAAQGYTQVLESQGGTSQKAKRWVEALWIAAGKTSVEAAAAGEEAMKRFGVAISDFERNEMLVTNITDAIRDVDLDDVDKTGEEIGTLLIDAIARSSNPRPIIDSVTDSLRNVPFEEIFSEVSDFTGLELLEIDSADELRDFYDQMMDGSYDFSAVAAATGRDVQTITDTAGLLVQMLQNDFTDLIGKSEELDKALAQMIAKDLKLDADLVLNIQGMDDLEQIREFQIATADNAGARAMYQQEVRNAWRDSLMYGKALTKEQQLQILNDYRRLRGLDRANDLSDGFKSDTRDAAEDSKKIQEELNKLPSSISVSIRGEQLSGLLSGAMSGIQDEISDRITSTREAAWEAQSNALDRRQEAAQNAFDARWERRREGVEKYYDARIEKVQEAIEAEEKAEEIRERIFEAEMTRLSRLTETANSTIDFNLALETGDLDEAAKLRNNMEATAREWALEDAGNKGAGRSERIRERLEARADRLSERKDKTLETLDKKEEAERASLERRQEAAREHQQAIQEIERESLEDQMELFKSFVPKNKAQLEAWMKEVGITYEKFGIRDLEPTSKEWARFFRDNFNEQIRLGGAEIVSDNMWESMGKEMALKTLRGMGFDSLAALEKFVMTGELPKNFLQTSKNAGKNSNNKGSGKAGSNGFVGPNNPNAIETWHTGGMVGSGSGSRKGVAKTAPLHKSEQMVRAQKGEFVVNRRSSAKYGNELDAINRGIFDPMSKGRDEGVMGGLGFSGIIASMIGRMFAAGVGRALMNGVDDKMQSIKSDPALGAFGNLGPGTYGGTTFTAEQLRNAKTIANVGKSLGASSRDIVIALMTAMQESTLRNLSYGDRDSVGLFQQRDAWGSFEARTNPEQAARMFFLGGAQGQRGLFDFPSRNSMSLTEAAQAVQVSAYPDAYAKWADEAAAIYKALTSGGGTAGGSVIQGSGANRPPVDRPWSSSYNIHGSPPAVDLGIPVGRNVYAAGSGTVITSADITGHEPRAPHGGLGYRSYGRYIVIGHDNGANTLYAHLSQRYARAGQRVAGGSIIGKSGNTGYSFGPHLHFGASNGPMAWLKTGGNTLSDGMAMLHKNETVLTEPLSKDLKDTVTAFGDISRNVGWENALAGIGNNRGYSVNTDSVASSTHNEYNVNVNVMQPNASPDQIANAVIKKIKREDARKPGKR